MQLHKVVLLCILPLVAIAGCKRLTFIKPDYDKMKIEQVKTTPNLRDSDADKRRMVAADSAEAAGNRLQAGDLNGAETAANNTIKNSPNEAAGYTILALVKQARGQSAEAGGYFQKAAGMPTAGPGEWGNYGSWLCENNRAAEGLGWIDRALQYRDTIDAGGMLANAGKCAMKAGQTARAEQNLREALSLSPENPVALDGMAELMLARGQTMDARAFSERRLGLGETAEALQRAIQIETRLGDANSAQRYRDRLKKLQTPNP